MVNLTINNLIALILIFTIFSCKSKNSNVFFFCSDCSDIEGVLLERCESSVYNFSLLYPIGYLDGMGKKIPYFKFNLIIKDMGDKLFVYDSVRSEFVNFLNLDIWSNKETNKFSVDESKIMEGAIDTAFTSNRYLVYEVRIKNLYDFNSYSHLPLFGQDFVFFISEKGLLGMYISRTEEELGIYDEVNASIGDVFYKKKNDLYDE